MLKARFCFAAAIAAAMVVSVSTSAEAFCHKYRSVPVWFGVYYPNCGPCGGCVMPYVASGAYGGYGYCGIGCGCPTGCGYGCGYAYGCGYGCMKKHCRWHAHKAYKRMMRSCGSCFDSYFGGSYDCACGGCGSCGDGCYTGCGGCSGDCSTGGCSDCQTGSGDSGEVLYDGPAPADSPAPPAMPQDQSARLAHPLIMLAGLHSQQADGSASFEQGLSAYRGGSLNEAVRQFEEASSAEPNNALYHYYRALAQHDMYGAEAAGDALAQAVEAERREPVKGWGKLMERVQGRNRLWIEKARREAGLTR
jgi:hypothetical protein